MIQNTLGFLSILLAEDNAINTLFVATVVNQWGCNLMVATNGNEAVDLVSKHHFDLILMDIQMPEKDGIEAAIEIRAMADITKQNIDNRKYKTIQRYLKKKSPHFCEQASAFWFVFLLQKIILLFHFYILKLVFFADVVISTI